MKAAVIGNRPYFTMGIVAYNNYKYIKEAVDSVLTQTYPNIQLIISNDGSRDFNEAEIKSYLKEKCVNNNIKEFIVKNHAENRGTVKNVNYVLSEAKGDYIMFMAADDALFDENVIETFVAEFQKIDKEYYAISAKVAMCTDKLSEIRSYEPQEDGIKAIKTFNSKEMFSRLTHTFTIPTTGTCYKKRLYDEIGHYDEDYYIIEDAPLYIKMANKDLKFYWLDGMIAARHRDGGISHGNSLELSEAYRRYRNDELLFFKKEVFPYKNKILPNDYKKMYKKWKWLELDYYSTFIKENESWWQKFKQPLHWKYMKLRVKEKILHVLGIRIDLLLKNRLGGLRDAGVVCLSSIVLLDYAEQFSAYSNDLILQRLGVLLCWLFGLDLLFSTVWIIIVILGKFYKKIKRG